MRVPMSFSSRVSVTASVPEFGQRIEGAQYRSRPGVYAVLIDFDGKVALIKTPDGWFLPGGGIDP